MKRLRDKMYNWEADPPTPSWDRIREALDESEMQAAFPARLRDMEATPPSMAWSRIEAGLDAAAPDNHATVVVVRQSRTRWFRYAAAIVLLAAAAWGISEWVNNNGTTVAPENTASANPVQPQAPKPTNNLPAPGPHVNASDSNAAQLLAQTTVPKNIAAANNNLQYAGGNAADQDYANELSKALYTYDDHQPDMAQKYVTLLTPDGSFIRLSKKWSHLICCIAGEESSDSCDKQVKAWQEQLAASPVTPAPGSFMDILDLVNSLSEGTRL